MIRTLMGAVLLGVACLAASGAPLPRFGGHWTFDPQESRNVGMMAGITIHTIVVELSTELIVDDASDFNGQKDTQRTVYDLTGKPVSNTPIMGGTATTRSYWEGERLVTVWESAGSIAGSTVKRTETRYLSPDGKTMYVESSRPGQDPMVMVFTRDR
jgi:hypothetical protein